MKIITTWHCTEILGGEKRGTPPREWLILRGPGEDVIFEIKSTLPQSIEPEKPAAQH